MRRYEVAAQGISEEQRAKLVRLAEWCDLSVSATENNVPALLRHIADDKGWVKLTPMGTEKCADCGGSGRCSECEDLYPANESCPACGTYAGTCRRCSGEGSVWTEEPPKVGTVLCVGNDTGEATKNDFGSFHLKQKQP